MKGQLIFIFFIMANTSGNSEENSLRGKHIVVLPVEVPPVMSLTRNASGDITSMSGVTVDMFHMIQEYLGFTYSVLKTIPGESFDDLPNIPGWKHHLLRKEADVAVGPMVLFAARIPVMDYTFPYQINSYRMLIPTPKLASNFGAPWKPFSFIVWTLLFTSAIAIVAAFVCISRFHHRTSEATSYYERNFFNNIGRASDYTVQVLMAQGGFCFPKRLPIRIIASVWCAATFVLVNSYYSTLISYVSASYRQPLIEDVNDIPTHPDVKIVINRGLAIDNVLSSADSGTLKYLGDMLRKDDSLRCSTTEMCLERVLSGSTVFITFEEAIITTVKEDMDKCGKCRFTMAKHSFYPFQIGFSFRKGSPYRRAVDIAMLRLQGVGLIPLRTGKLPLRYAECLKTNQDPAKIQLGLKNLSSAFLLLSFGYGTALIALFGEWVVHKFHGIRLFVL